MFLLQDEARKKFREGDALKYLGFVEKAIGDGGKDGYAVSNSVCLILISYRVKSGNFEHQVNSDSNHVRFML